MNIPEREGVVNLKSSKNMVNSEWSNHPVLHLLAPVQALAQDLVQDLAHIDPGDQADLAPVQVLNK